MEALKEAFAQFLTECSPWSILGFTAVVWFTLVLVKAVVYVPFKLYCLAQVLPGIDLAKLGKWAVITGATDGIGKGYAESLAKKGLNVVLISRSEEKLLKVATDIKHEFGVQVKTVTVDFTNADIYGKIEESLTNLDIAILVNNVGTSASTGLFLDTANVQSTVDVIHVNCVSVTNMCALVLPHMVEKRKGVIVNISSAAAEGFIGSTLYSSTKAYVSLFSECLMRTYKDTGVIVQTLEPGMVETNLLRRVIDRKGKSINFMEDVRKLGCVSVNSYVNSALNSIGWADKHPGHVIHYLFYLLSRLNSTSYVDRISRHALKASE